LSGDYSYGLFLYGYPLQQALMSIGPEVRHWYLNLLLAIPCAAVVAASSWWLIEKPALSLRRYLKQFEEWYLFKRSLAKETVMEAAANEEAAAVEVPAPD
jgi:peptidoglycan/LPS O-acetylase OafA/YrhL